MLNAADLNRKSYSSKGTIKIVIFNVLVESYLGIAKFNFFGNYNGIWKCNSAREVTLKCEAVIFYFIHFKECRKVQFLVDNLTRLLCKV